MGIRRLPVYILLDTSGSMRGEPISSVNVGLQSMLSALRQDPYALESVYLSIITFDVQAQVYLPLTPLEQVQLRHIDVPSSGATFMGAGLALLAERMQQEMIKSTPTQKGDWRPLLFIMTDGSPSDVYAYEQILPVIKRLNFASIIACAAGPKAKAEYLQQLTDQVVVLDTMDASGFSQFFKWVSDILAEGSISTSQPTSQQHLPPPPPEIQLVF